MGMMFSCEELKASFIKKAMSILGMAYISMLVQLKLKHHGITYCTTTHTLVPIGARDRRGE